MIARRGMGGLTIFFTLPVWPILNARFVGWMRWARRALYVFGGVLVLLWLWGRSVIDPDRMGVADEDIGMALYMVLFWAVFAWHHARAAALKREDLRPEESA